MPYPPLQVLYEDNHLLAVVKPAGLATMGVSSEAPSLFTLAKDYIKLRYQKPGNVYLGVVSRLDRLVTGVTLFARTSKAAARLTEQFRTHQVEKIYWALVEGEVALSEGELRNHLFHDDAAHRMRSVGPTHPGAKEARLRYRLLQKVGGDSVVEVELLTGRKHQIRLQWSDRGHPIWGDKKYGSGRSFPDGIALHARFLRFSHPVKKTTICLESPLPSSWPKIVRERA